MTIEMKKTNRKQSDHKRTMIMKHIDENTDQYEFKCQICSRRLKTHHALGGHASSHKKIKPINKYHDALCMLSLNISPTVSYWLYECKICKKEFETGRALGGHMRTHSRFKKGLNVFEEKCLWQQEAEKVNVGISLESDSSVLTMVELERRKAEEDERVRLSTQLVMAAKKLQLFLD